MKKVVLHRIAIIVAAIAVGSAGIATDAFARGGGGGGGHFGGGIGGGHFGGAMGGGRFGGAMGGAHLGGIGGAHLGGRVEHGRYGHYRAWGAPYGYYGYSGDDDSCWPPEYVRPWRLHDYC